MKQRVVNLYVLPGEPTDGSGRVAIHLFVQDERGPFIEPNALHLVEADTDGGTPQKKLAAWPTRGRLACDPRRTVAPVVRGNVTTVTPRTDDPRAVTCPRCKASAEYAEIMYLLESAPTAGK